MRRFFTLPTMLTLTRLVISPLMLPVLLVYLLPYNSLIINIFLSVLFVLLSLTDFFDGYFARKFNQVTKLGKHLDPLADKFLFYSALVALLASGKIFFYWVIILIGRDFFVMGLRAIAHEHNFSVPVSFFGKIKTTAQMVFLGFLILNPYQSAGFFNTWNLIEFALLLTVLVLCVLSAKSYYSALRQKLGPLGFGDQPTPPFEQSSADQFKWPEDTDSQL